MSPAGAHARISIAFAVTLTLGGCGSQGPDVEQAARSAPEPPLWGVQAGLGLGVLPVQRLAGDVARVGELGANAVRIAIPWAWLQSRPEAINPARATAVDRLVAAADDQGLGVVAVLTRTPCWASTTPRDATGACRRDAVLYPPRDAALYGDFVEQVIDRWGSALSGIEVWNEPNRPGFWRGTPAEYVALVRTTSEVVDGSRYADLPVVGGVLAGVDLAYLRTLLDEGLSDWTDAISIHPYDIRWGERGFGDPSVSREDDQTSFAFAVPQAHDLVGRFGSDDPIWITEFGYPTCPARPHCATAALQADYLQKAVELVATWGYVDAFFVFQLRDSPVGSSLGMRFGILNEDGSAKPAAAALSKAFEALRR